MSVTNFDSETISDVNYVNQVMKTNFFSCNNKIEIKKFLNI
jgi:hypothetical protein